MTTEKKRYDESLRKRAHLFLEGRASFVRHGGECSVGKKLFSASSRVRIPAIPVNLQSLFFPHALNGFEDSGRKKLSVFVVDWFQT